MTLSNIYDVTIVLQIPSTPHTSFMYPSTIYCAKYHSTRIPSILNTIPKCPCTILTVPAQTQVPWPKYLDTCSKCFKYKWQIHINIVSTIPVQTPLASAQSPLLQIQYQERSLKPPLPPLGKRYIKSTFSSFLLILSSYTSTQT